MIVSGSGEGRQTSRGVGFGGGYAYMLANHVVWVACCHGGGKPYPQSWLPPEGHGEGR